MPQIYVKIQNGKVVEACKEQIEGGVVVEATEKQIEDIFVNRLDAACDGKKITNTTQGDDYQAKLEMDQRRATKDAAIEEEIQAKKAAEAAKLAKQ